MENIEAALIQTKMAIENIRNEIFMIYAESKPLDVNMLRLLQLAEHNANVAQTALKQLLRVNYDTKKGNN